jgi:hypothetical protein
MYLRYNVFNSVCIYNIILRVVLYIFQQDLQVFAYYATINRLKLYKVSYNKINLNKKQQNKIYIDKNKTKSVNLRNFHKNLNLLTRLNKFVL